MGEVRLQGFLKYGDCVVKALLMSLSTWLVDVAGMVGTTNARQFLYFLDIPEKPTRVSTAQHCGLTKHNRTLAFCLSLLRTCNLIRVENKMKYNVVGYAQHACTIT